MMSTGSEEKKEQPHIPTTTGTATDNGAAPTDEAGDVAADEPDIAVDVDNNNNMEQGIITKPDAPPGTADVLERSFEVIDQPPLSFTKDDGIPTIATFKDHFTLPIPTSTVRYREKHSAARILEGSNSQFVLEETYQEETQKHMIEIRKIHSSSEGVRFLRIMYALVTAFFTGFLFVLCLQVLLFLVLDLALESGATTHATSNWGAALGAILGFPALVYGFSSALVLAGAYIVDTYKGHYLIRNFTFRTMDPVTVEWLFFCFFLGFPVLVMSIALLVAADIWWEVTLLFWFACIGAFYLLFCANVIFYELRACWQIIQNRYDDDNDAFFHVLHRCIMTRQISTYSGLKNITYLARGTIEDSEYTDKYGVGSSIRGVTNPNMIEGSYHEETLWRTRLTQWKKLTTENGKWGLWENLEEQGKEERVYTIDDARDVRPYMTSYTWNLEKIFCRPRNSRYIAIVKGPSAVTQSQMKSSVACSLLGTFLIYFFIFSALIYMGLGIVFTMFIVAVGVIVAIPTFRSTFTLYKLNRGLIKLKILDKFAVEDEPEELAAGAEPDEKESSEAVYLVQENYRVSRPTPWFCWLMFFVELSLLFVYPFWSLYAVGNYPLATLFLVIAGLSFIRYYINASIVLEETGHMDLVGGGTEEQVWRNQSRLNEIVGNITRGRSRGAWMAVLGTIGFVFLGLFLGALGTNTEGSEDTVDVPNTYTTNFEYIQKDSLRYPSCQLTAGVSDDSPIKSMADFIFLAGLAYRTTPEITQQELDSWFGPGGAVNQDQIVSQWKEDAKSEVSFKMVTIPTTTNTTGDFAYVTIRGTSNPWDMLTDAQLWSAAFLMQGLRELLPLGVIWTPVIDQLIKAMTILESKSIQRVSFYKDTTAFVNFLKEQVDAGVYSGVGVTGHSLGGGLAMITGAQTGTPAVGLSGPNAMLSRQTFDPPVSAEALDSKTFNIIPERDVVPMIDDRAQNFQFIRCNTEMTDVIGCHTSFRSLCEVIYTCGSRDRPVLCECVTQYGYPVPKAKDGFNTTTFEEFCGIN